MQPFTIAYILRSGCETRLPRASARRKFCVRLRSMMTPTSSSSLALVLLLTPMLGAQQPATQPQLPKSQMPDLGRPTKSSDPLPLFDFDRYFAGRWSFEWDVPDSPLGPAGTVTGTTTYTRIDDLFYEATTQATGPTGSITMKDTFGYRKENKTLARQVSDSRGFSCKENEHVS